MSLLSVLKTVGHDLKDVGDWIVKALPEVGSVISIVDPPLAPIIGTVEGIIADLSKLGKAPTASELQAIVQAVTLLQSIQSVINLPKPVAP